jgi:hypothetical protein
MKTITVEVKSISDYDVSAKTIEIALNNYYIGEYKVVKIEKEQQAVNERLNIDKDQLNQKIIEIAKRWVKQYNSREIEPGQCHAEFMACNYAIKQFYEFLIKGEKEIPEDPKRKSFENLVERDSEL